MEVTRVVKQRQPSDALPDGVAEPINSGEVVKHDGPADHGAFLDDAKCPTGFPYQIGSGQENAVEGLPSQTR